MFPKFSDVIAALDDLKARGLIREYAIFGAIAQAFWDEAIPTFDLDVLVLLAGPQELLLDLGPIYRWAEENGYPTQDEHIIIGEIPVQIVPAPTALHEEAIRSAATLDFSGTPIRVVRPEVLDSDVASAASELVWSEGTRGQDARFRAAGPRASR